MWMLIETLHGKSLEPGTRILLMFAGEQVSVAYWDLYYAPGGRGYRGLEAWVEPVSGELLQGEYGLPIAWMQIPGRYA